MEKRLELNYTQSEINYSFVIDSWLYSSLIQSVLIGTDTAIRSSDEEICERETFFYKMRCKDLKKAI